MAAFEVALAAHELVKVQFLAEKDRAAKRELAAEMEERSGAECLGRIGHMAIFFRRQEDPERRRVKLPGEEGL
jgi:RNA-binding protein